jgi:hypothetical protein
MNDILDGHVADLGGHDNVSLAELSILRRAAVITIELERLEARFSQGEPTGADLDLYQRASGNLRRLLESVGLQRRAKDMSYTIDDLARELNAQPVEPIEAEPVVEPVNVEPGEFVEVVS